MWFYRRAYKKSQKIFTVSVFSKSRILHHLGAAKPIIVTYSAVQPIFLACRNNVKNVQKTQTIVFIGNIKKHKGLDLLLEAFCQARSEGLPHSLIIIGDRENFRTADNAVLHKIDSLGREAVSFTGFISDERLLEYLADAELLVQPSLYEGFGLPPLEAMVLGTHALISDIPVFREIYNGFPVTFFRAGDSQSLKDRMIEQLNNCSTVSLAKELAEKYTSEKTASIIMEALQ
jgi:glycosyltransferase involved in cell wall biosynthesis